MSSFYNFYIKVDNKEPSEIISQADQYIQTKYKGITNEECFSLLNDVGEQNFEPEKIVDFDKTLNKIIASPALGAVEYLLPFGRIDLNFIANEEQKVQGFLFSFEDFVFEKNKEEIEGVIGYFHSEFCADYTIGGWGLFYSLDELLNGELMDEIDFRLE